MTFLFPLVLADGYSQMSTRRCSDNEGGYFSKRFSDWNKYGDIIGFIKRQYNTYARRSLWLAPLS